MKYIKLPLILITLIAQVYLPIRVTGGSNSILNTTDITYVGALRAPNNTTLAAYGGLSGRRVGGSAHLFIYGSHDYYARNANVDTPTSSTVFTINNQFGGQPFIITDRISVGHTTGTATPQSTVITGVSGAQLTVSPALSGTPTSGDYVWREGDYIEEIVDPGSGYTNNYATTVQATCYAYWLDPYHGRRVSWSGGNIKTQSNYPGFYLPSALYWNTTNSLLYWTYYDSYNVSGAHDWALGASDIGSFSSCSSPSDLTNTYGPWRTASTDGDGNTWYGGWRMGNIFKHPTSGDMLGMGLSRSGDASINWGPNVYGCPFPTTSTAGGFAASDLTCNDKYAEFYLPIDTSGHYYQRDGTPVGAIRQFQFTKPTGYGYVFQTFYDTPRTQADPAKNGGISTNTDDVSAYAGGLWFNGTNKQGVLVPATLPLTATQSNSDCATAHEWYANSGQVAFYLNATSNLPYVAGEVVTGQTSTAVATVGEWIGGANNEFRAVQTTPQQATNFVAGEVVIGGTSNAHGTITLFHRNDVSYPGSCSAPIGGITGPVTTAASAIIYVFDPADLTARKNGSATDYTLAPVNGIDLEVNYSIQLAPITSPGSAKSIGGFWLDTTTNNFYLIARAADLTLGGGSPQNLIHVFHINDSPAPSPLPVTLIQLSLLLLAIGYAKTS